MSEDDRRLMTAMEDELRLLRAAESLLGRMDAAISADSPSELHDAVYAATRVLHTLEQAQERRAALLHIRSMRRGVTPAGERMNAALARLNDCGEALRADIATRRTVLDTRYGPIPHS